MFARVQALDRGFTARFAAPRPAYFLSKIFPPGRFAPHGEKPRRFSPYPFCGVCEKYKRLYRFFTFARPAFIGRRIVAAAASLAALMLGGTRLSALLAPCALGGDRLATTVCKQTPLALVTYRPAKLRSRQRAPRGAKKARKAPPDCGGASAPVFVIRQ